MNSGELSPIKLKQQEFWSALRENFKARDSNMRVQAPGPQHWLNFSMGSSFCHIALTINSKENFVSCDLWTNNKEFLVFLQEQEDEIRKELGLAFDWWEANKSGGTRTKLRVDDVYDQAQFTYLFDWLYTTVKLFQKVFKKYTDEFKQI